MQASSGPGGQAFEEAETFRGIVANLPAALYSTDADGRITYFNPAAADLWGRSPVIGEEFWCGSWRLYWLDGKPMPHEECPMAVTVKTGKPVRGAEAIAERPDGSRFRFTPFPTPMFDSEGNLAGAVNMLVEISGDRKDGQAAQRDAQRMAKVDRVASDIARDFAIASLFDQAARLVHREEGEASPIRWAIMRYLSLSTAAREAADIATYLGVDVVSIARDISLLTRHGFIERPAVSTSETERFKLSENGRAAMQLDPLKRLAKAIAQLSEERRDALAGDLETVADRLIQDDPA